VVEKKSVNVNLQTVLIFLPFVWIWGFYRIDKLRRGLGLMFGIGFAVLFAAVMVSVITGVDAREFTNWTWVFYIVSVLIGIYYMRKWSLDWNDRIEPEKQ